MLLKLPIKLELTFEQVAPPLISVAPPPRFSTFSSGELLTALAFSSRLLPTAVSVTNPLLLGGTDFLEDVSFGLEPLPLVSALEPLPPVSASDKAIANMRSSSSLFN